MTQLLYFVPTDKPTIAAKDLRALGLGHLGLRGDPLPTGCVGPGGVRGLVFAGDGKGKVGYAPASQAWHAGPDAAYHVGLPAGDPPTPDDLAKPRFLDGEVVTIGEQRWTIPICRSLVRGATLPEAMVLGPDGKAWTFKQLPEFTSLCLMADAVWAELDPAAGEAGRTGRDAEAGMRYADAAPYAVAALGVNYRVGPVEASALGLLTTETVRDILKAMVDYFELERVAAAAAAAGPGAAAAAEKNAAPGT